MSEEKKKEKKEGEVVPVSRVHPFWSRYWPAREFMGRELSRMAEDVDNVLSGFWSDDFWAWPPSAVKPWRRLEVDIKDEGDKYVLEADMPGVSREDISVEIHGNMLDISAEKERKEEVEKKGYVRRERGYVSYCRRLRLPDDANREGIEAKLEGGVLKLEIAKSAEKKEEKKKVEVN